jgi:hypothetical protein
LANLFPNIIIPEPVNQVSKLSIQPTTAVPDKINLANIADASRVQFTQQNPYMKVNDLYTPIWTVPTKETLRYNDPIIGYSAFNPDIEQDYADKQSGLSSAWNQTKSGFGKFLSTAIGGFSDIPDTIEALGTGSLDAFSNTGWKNALLEWSDALTENNPVYETRYVKEHPWMSFINPLEFKSFTQRWGTVAENLGFTAGAIANAVVTDAALLYLTGGAGDALLLPKQIATISKSIFNLGKAFEVGKTSANMAKILATPKNILSELKAISSANKTGDVLRTSLNLYNSAVGEASIEAYHNFKETKQLLIDEYKNIYGVDPGLSEIQNIEEDARSSGNATFLANTGLLMATNYLTFGKLLKPTSVALREANQSLLKSGITRVAGNLDDVAVATRSTKLMDRFVNTMKKIPSTLKTSVTEGFEEGSQFTISESTKDYWKAKYRGSDEADQVFKSLSKGVQNTLTTREGMENIIMGALSGVLINGGSSVINRGRSAYRGEGFVGSKNKAINAAVNMMNSTAGLTGSISSLHNELSTNLDIEKRMESAVQSGNIEEAKNFKADAFYNWISSANKSGLIHLRMEALADAKTLKDDDFANFWGIDYSQSNAKTAEKYIGLLEQRAKDYIAISDKVEDAFGKNPFSFKKEPIKYRAFEDYKQALGHSLMEVKDSEQRMQSVTSDLKAIFPGVDVNSAMNLTTKEGLEVTIKQLNTKISNLKIAEDSSKSTPSLYNKIHEERVFLEKQAAVFANTINGKTSIDEYKEAYRKTLSYLNNSDAIDSDVFPATIDETFEQLHALNHLKKRSIDALNYYTILRNKNGFENFSQEVADEISNIYSKRIAIKDGKMYIKSNQQVVYEQEKALLDASNSTFALSTSIATEKALEQVPEIEEGITDAEIDKLNEVSQKIINNQPLTEEEQKLAEEFPLATEREKVKNEIKAELDSTLNPTTVPETTITPSVDSNPVIVTKKTDPNIIYSLFGNIFSYVPKDKDSAAEWKEAMAAKKVVEQPSSPVSAFYTKYILKSPIFKFIFGDKLIVNDTKIVVRTLSPEKTYLPSRIETTKLYRQQSLTEATLYINGRPTGNVSNTNNILVDKDGKMIPLEDIMEDMNENDFVDITGYDKSLFQTFKDSFKAYKALSDNIFSRATDKEVTIENEVVKSLLSVTPLLSGYKSVSDPKDATMLEDIKALGDNSYIISTKRIFAKDETSGNYKEMFVVNVIGNNGIISPENYEPSLKALMDDKIFVANLKSNNSRYALLNRLPNGQFSTASKVLARPATTKLQDLEAMFQALKANDLETVLSIIQETYIADNNLPKGSRIKIDFSVSEDNKLWLSVTQNTGRKKGDKFIEDIKNISEIDLLEIAASVNTLEEFLSEINIELTSAADIVKITLNPNNFKKYIADDEAVKFDDFKSTLSVATTPYFYNKIQLAVLPSDIAATQPAPQVQLQPTTEATLTSASPINTTNPLVESEKITIFAKEYDITDTEGISKAKALQFDMNTILIELISNNTIQKTKCS